MIMILTGVVLMMNYTPSVERAYDSVKDIMFILPGGRYIRNIHRWSGHGMVLISFLHLIRVFFTGGYLGGRRRNWIFGVVILFLVMFMNFSGYLLPWDQLAFWAVTIGSNIAASFRELTDILGITQVLDIGGFIKRLLLGDEQVGQSALSRVFMLHVVFLPVTLMVLIGLELLETMKSYLEEDKVHVEVVFLVAIIAVARKFIIMDYSKLAPTMLLGMAATILALSGGPVLRYTTKDEKDVRM